MLCVDYCNAILAGPPRSIASKLQRVLRHRQSSQYRPQSAPSSAAQQAPLAGCSSASVVKVGLKVKVKVGFLYSATYTANQNSALHNLGSGSWLARASGAAALCSLSTARANRHWTRSCSQQTHHRPNQPHQAFTLVSFRQVSPLHPK